MNKFTIVITLTLACIAISFMGCTAFVDEDEELVAARTQAALHSLFKPGLVYHLDGEDYFIDGPLENGVRDLPGHDWVRIGKNLIFGRHFNTGPFGIPKWWSSDADDGQLLYLVWGVFDTWSPAKVEKYRSLGFSHYHELVTVNGRVRHPSKVVWFKHIAVASFNLDGGPKPWFGHEVKPGLDPDFAPNLQFPYPPKEKFVYVGCVNAGDSDPDFLAVIGADPNDPTTYSKIVHRVDMPGTGDELHHWGFNIFQTRLLVPGLLSGRMHILNIEDDPAHPYVESYHDNLTPDSGYIVPHTVIGLPSGGYMVSMIGSDSPSSAPGGLVELDADANFIGPFGPPAERESANEPPYYMYDVGINRLRNRMVSTTFGLPNDIIDGITISGLGNEVYVWDFKKREVIQTVDFGPGAGALEVRWLNDPGSTIGFTNAPGSSAIWRWHDVDLDGHYEFSVAIQLPPLTVPTDILLSSDDKYLYISNWVANNVMQYDISDPFNPIFVSEVTIPYSQMMRLSPDNRRLYVTNSLLSTWDDFEFPEGVTRNEKYGMFLVDIDHENGGMELNNDFFIDFSNVQKKNTVGPARPHQAFFDPSVSRDFGSH